MIPNDVSFAELRSLLLSLGFVEVRSSEPGVGYRHVGSDTLLLFREYRPKEAVSPRDVFMAQFFLDQRGLMKPDAFENYFRKTPA
jgi:hypothetical protein